MTIKNRFFIPNFSMVIFIVCSMVIIGSCKKDPIDPPVDDPDKVLIDSGQYNPNHYLPMKMGATWEYLHDNGRIEKVTCTEKLHHAFKDAYNVSYSYDAHHLISDYPNKELPEIEPMLQGAFAAGESRISRPYRDFCIRALLQDRKIFDIHYGVLRYQSIYSCGAGPSPWYFIVCLDSSGSLDSFPEVAVMLYAKMETFRSSINPSEDIETDMYKLLEPLILEGNAAYSVSWFAKGVGLVRRDIYENQVLVDRMRLVKYYFP